MTFSGSRHFLVVELALLWWPCRSSRNARPQTPPGPEGSNGSGGRVCRDVAVGAASISGHAFDPAGPSASLIPLLHNSGTKRWYNRVCYLALSIPYSRICGSVLRCPFDVAFAGLMRRLRCDTRNFLFTQRSALLGAPTCLSRLGSSSPRRILPCLADLAIQGKVVIGLEFGDFRREGGFFVARQQHAGDGAQ